jgi:peptide/nickel transport system ATP-binding protein
MTASLLTVNHLTVELGSAAAPLRVIDDVALELTAGATLALVGESGCGKSLTALALMRLLPPAARIVNGAVRLGDTDLLRLTEAEMRQVRGGRVAMIFQEPQTALNPVLTVGAQIAEALNPPNPPLLKGGLMRPLAKEGLMRPLAKGEFSSSPPFETSSSPFETSSPPFEKGGSGGILPTVGGLANQLPIDKSPQPPFAKGGPDAPFFKGGLESPQPPFFKGGLSHFDRVIALLDAVGIPDPALRYSDYPHQLSGGMKQRVMIALALAGNPQLLIADEPTTALDVTIQAQVLRLLKELQRDTGMALLLITHDLGVVAETAERLAVMYAGQIVETAGVTEFFAAPAHPYSRQLLASLPSAAQRGERLAMIPGRVPPLDTVFVGCRFADRCAEVLEICRTAPPPWRVGADGRGVRCWRVEEVGSEEVGSCQLAVGSTADLSRAGAAPAPTSPLLQLADIQVYFPIQRGLLRRTVAHIKAVDGVTLDLAVGQTLALVGESGCGKTTVGKAIVQLLPTTGGTIRYRIHNTSSQLAPGAPAEFCDLTALKPRQRRPFHKEVQIIFQDPFAAMNPRLLVGDVIGEGLQALGLAPRRAERMRRVAELLELVGLDPSAVNRYPHEFSGGQRQRICIARALAVAPRILICDEPTSALDVSVQAQILNLLKDLQERLGLTYLFITHNLAVVSYLAHTVAVMYLGRIVEQGAVTELLADPRHPYTRALLSAAPVIDPAARRPIIRLEGELPSPRQPPSGCHFHPRCPAATADCASHYPAAQHFGAGRMVRCHHANCAELTTAN